MKKIIFYFEDGSYKAIFGYGKNANECINDAESYLTKQEREAFISVSCFEPMTSEY